MINQLIVEFYILSPTIGSRCSDDPSASAVRRAKMTMRDVAATVTAVTKASACVTFMRAAFTCPREICTAATTEHPTPVISPRPVKSIITGTQRLTAAMPSLPTPWPMKMPSTAVTAERLNMPNKVGMNIRRKSFGTSTVPKSIAFLFISPCFCVRAARNPATRGRKKGRVVRLVLPSHLIRLYFTPSDEDYKTRSYCIRGQR